MRSAFSELTQGLTAIALAAMLLTYVPIASAHWPGQPGHQIAYLGDLQLEAGGVFKNFRV